MMVKHDKKEAAITATESKMDYSAMDEKRAKDSSAKR